LSPPVNCLKTGHSLNTSRRAMSGLLNPCATSLNTSSCRPRDTQPVILADPAPVQQRTQNSLLGAAGAANQ
jgi:hypothetical protein